VKVLIYATGRDTGGQGQRIVDAFARIRPDWTVESIAYRHPFGYPIRQFASVRERDAVLRRLYAEADVVHLRNNLAGWHQLDRRNGKPTIVHHHGTMFRTFHRRLAQEARAAGIVQAASTLDLTTLEPDVAWLPAPYDLPALEAMRADYRKGDRLRVAHFPTNPKVKSSAIVSAAVGALDVEYVHNLARGRVRPMPWADVLAHKAQADIYVDQLRLGYGNNAIEAWAMGVPVVAGVADPTVRALMVERFGRLPFVEASEADLPRVLSKLVKSPAMRAEYAELGQEHVRRWHDGSQTVEILTDLYQRAAQARKARRAA
jgi:hypothetical protein